MVFSKSLFVHRQSKDDHICSFLMIVSYRFFKYITKILLKVYLLHFMETFFDTNHQSIFNLLKIVLTSKVMANYLFLPCETVNLFRIFQFHIIKHYNKQLF